ncbi:hypothetical protein M378DRAFT_673986 [Amanita muscaria Koide BX008]|uniref:Uncharacterized protein n=1 Tax=Amanita muscaria (strain Koide BX008) TaxID=946122 RepID=A0A0C2X3K1_AMAMK|nr:hypothetical protein M378DRAFT_673986 [Amanita muscaria Koide BX008]
MVAILRCFNLHVSQNADVFGITCPSERPSSSGFNPSLVECLTVKASSFKLKLQGLNMHNSLSSISRGILLAFAKLLQEKMIEKKRHSGSVCSLHCHNELRCTLVKRTPFLYALLWTCFLYLVNWRLKDYSNDHES